MKSFLKHIFYYIFSDFFHKMSALLIAAFLWYYVNILSIEKIYISLPVTIKNLPENFTASAKDKLSVRLEIRTREDISTKLKTMEAYLDLSNPRIGDYFYPIKLTNVPENIHASILPYSLKISIDNLTNKKVPVQLSLQKKDDARKIINYSLTPAEVTLQGAENILNKISNIYTESLNSSALMEPKLNTNIGLIVQSNVSLKENSKIQLQAQIYVENYTNELLIPLQMQGLTEELMVEDHWSIPIIVQSPFTNISYIESNIKASIDMSTITKSGFYAFPVAIDTLPYITVLSNLFPIVRVSIKEKTVENQPDSPFPKDEKNPYESENILEN